MSEELHYNRFLYQLSPEIFLLRENPSHPSREKGAVLELSQVEGDEERPRHENQGQQSGVGLSGDINSLSVVVWKRAVGLNQSHVFCRCVSFCAVVEGAAFQRVLRENLHT